MVKPKRQTLEQRLAAAAKKSAKKERGNLGVSGSEIGQTSPRVVSPAAETEMETEAECESEKDKAKTASVVSNGGSKDKPNDGEEDSLVVATKTAPEAAIAIGDNDKSSTYPPAKKNLINLPQNYTVIPLEQLQEDIESQLNLLNDDMSSKIQDLQQKLSKQQTISKRKEDELEKVKKQLKSLSTKDTNTLERQLKEKSHQVDELLKEGMELSKKEVSLTQTIKKLRQRELSLEKSLEDSELQVDKLEGKLDDLKDKQTEFDASTLALEEERSLRATLQQRYDSLLKANDSLMDELKEIKMSKLDVKLESATNELQSERKLKVKFKDDLDDLESKFKIFKNEKLLLISNLEKQLSEQTYKNTEITRENLNEVKRLEGKIESLRYQTEQQNSNSNSNMSNKEIDLVQSQFDQAKENWKLIESTYVKRINTLESEIDELKDVNMNYNKKIKMLNKETKSNQMKMQELQDNDLNLQNKIDSYVAQIENLNKQIVLMKTNYESLQKDYQTEKDSFESQLKLLEEEKNRLEAIIRVRNDLNSQSQLGLHLSDSQLSQTSFKHSFLNSSKRFSIPFGESAITPRHSSSASFTFNKFGSSGMLMSPEEKIYNHQSSMLSLDEEFPINMEASTSDPLHQQPSGLADSSASASASVSNFLSTSFENSQDELPFGADYESSDKLSTINGGGRLSITPSNSGGNSGGHIQMMKKLSSHIQRLELELNFTKKEMSKLLQEKEDAGTQIMRLLEENKSVQKLKDEVTVAERQQSSAEVKLDKVLVLLGRKEERVLELEADVKDLKDVMKEQVMEMVQLQEKFMQK